MSTDVFILLFATIAGTIVSIVIGSLIVVMLYMSFIKTPDICSQQLKAGQEYTQSCK